MTHIAITEPREGTSVQWMEKVTDEQYSAAPPGSETQPSKSQQTTARPSGPVQQGIAPGLATLTDDVLFGDVWRRSELSPRDRSLVTISVLIATGKPAQLAGHLGRALDNGVLASEASGVLAHLAIYGGWPSAVSALAIYDQVHRAKGRHHGTERRGLAPSSSRPGHRTPERSDGGSRATSSRRASDSASSAPGCMGMSTNYGAPADRQEMIALIRSAVDRGVRFFRHRGGVRTVQVA